MRWGHWDPASWGQGMLVSTVAVLVYMVESAGTVEWEQTETAENIGIVVVGNGEWRVPVSNSLQVARHVAPSF